MSDGQKLAMLKICSTSVRFLSLCNLEAAPEETIVFRQKFSLKLFIFESVKCRKFKYLLQISIFYLIY